MTDATPPGGEIGIVWSETSKDDRPLVARTRMRGGHLRTQLGGPVTHGHGLDGVEKALTAASGDPAAVKIVVHRGE